MNDTIVFRGENYTRTRQERSEKNEPSLKQVLDNFFNDLRLDDEKKKELRAIFSDTIKTAIDNIRKEKKHALTKEEKVGILNRALFRLSQEATLATQKESLHSEKLIPELVQREEFPSVCHAAEEWLHNTPKEGQQRLLVAVQLDLDEFKPINDTYGHNAGDAILREFGQALHASTRPEDQGIHFSGDEFGLLMEFEVEADTSDTDISSIVEQALKRIVATIEISVRRPDKQTQLISIGYAIARPSESDIQHSVFPKADRAVGISKIRGIAGILEDQSPKSSERITNISDIHEYEEHLSENKKIVLRGLQALKRTLRDIAIKTDTPIADLTKRAYDFLMAQLNTTEPK